MNKFLMPFLFIMFLLLPACTSLSTSIPASYNSDLAVKNGDVVDVHGRTYNVEKLDAFIDAVNNRQKAKVQIISYTVEGDPIARILEYDGRMINYTYDNSMDKFAGRDKGIMQRKMVKAIKEESQGKVNYYLVDDLENKTGIFTACQDYQDKDLREKHEGGSGGSPLSGLQGRLIRQFAG
ncbi:MAG: DUF4362 domain-containing protein [Peptococcaceae bacterium]|nr:DUF4362 domain-containing protein [Peptococcaceae bacterium]